MFKNLWNSLLERILDPLIFKYSGLPGHEGRKGFYMHCFSGGVYFPCDPRADEMNIIDIAHHLSNQCRFAGASKHFLSTAEHSYLCSFVGDGIYTPQEQLEKLMHDGAEAYIQDMIRPLKYLPFFSVIYKMLERRNEVVMAKKYGLRYPFGPHVKHADEMICNLEMNHNIARAHKGHLHDEMKVQSGLRLHCWSPEHAEFMFLARFDDLLAQIKNPVALAA